MNIERTGKKRYNPISIGFAPAEVSMYDKLRKELTLQVISSDDYYKHNHYVTLTQDEINMIAQYSEPVDTALHHRHSEFKESLDKLNEDDYKDLMGS